MPNLFKKNPDIFRIQEKPQLAYKPVVKLWQFRQNVSNDKHFDEWIRLIMLFLIWSRLI